jgi:hypothetical protein
MVPFATFLGAKTEQQVAGAATTNRMGAMLGGAERGVSDGCCGYRDDRFIRTVPLQWTANAQRMAVRIGLEDAELKDCVW